MLHNCESEIIRVKNVPEMYSEERLRSLIDEAKYIKQKIKEF